VPIKCFLSDFQIGIFFAAYASPPAVQVVAYRPGTDFTEAVLFRDVFELDGDVAHGKSFKISEFQDFRVAFS